MDEILLTLIKQLLPDRIKNSNNSDTEFIMDSLYKINLDIVEDRMDQQDFVGSIFLIFQNQDLSLDSIIVVYAFYTDS